MAIELVSGNIFNTRAQVVVNTVNCVGVMGKGIALVYKLRYPKMFDLYQEHCKSIHLRAGPR
jgi:O-acetyl-ADP-ribose deacetylase (regulator of RNase III)